MFEIPDQYNDLSTALSSDGFIVGDTWYHGTTSVLAESILQNGLIGSGDAAMNQSIHQTMLTIGNKEFVGSEEPVYLTPNKALAYYWASQKANTRNKRFGTDEKPAVIEVKLEDAQDQNIRPDVGARAFLLLKEGEAYLQTMYALYESANQTMPDVDLMKLERDKFISVLGLAYLEEGIAAQHVNIV